MNPKPTMDAMVHLWGQLTLEERAMLLDQSMFPRVKRLLSRAVRRQVANTFVTPHSDEEAVHLLVKLKRLERPKALRMITTWRKLAAELGYTGPVAWQVREGFTLKIHGPKAGPSHQNWIYLQDWQLQNDESTIASIVLWIPQLLPNSVRMNVEEQLVFLGELRTRLALPAHHLSKFGSAALQTALIQAHAKRTGERTPLNGYVSRTDTLHVDGGRLGLYWGVGVLYCDGWSGDVRGDVIGVFPLGVEALGNSET